ncbi:MAG: helix-turn-helix transcriptional regulator, partial [Pygmaiobacter massiliensis]|nr:helix-turn-helix transcriptional regulator [Pygmaiobacter massiliensis]
MSKDSRLVGNSFFGGWATMMFAGGGRVDQIKIGKFIASLRRGKGWTQQQLADQLGITNKTVSRWENARYLPDVEMLQLLAELFEVSVAELLAGEVSNTKKAVRNRSEAFDELKEQTFTTPERCAYWKRKWLQEHCVSLGLEVASLLSGFVAGRLL